MLGSPSKVRVRGGKQADATALARIFKDAWLLAYRGIIPHLHLESMVRQRSPEWWRDALKSGDSALVLEMAGTVAGYATIGSSRQRGPFQGEIYELYLDPIYQGLGLGEHLFEGCRHALDMRKLNGLIVWALLDNTGACDFYWRRGGRPVASAFTKIGGAPPGEGRLHLAVTSVQSPYGTRTARLHIGLLPVAPSACGSLRQSKVLACLSATNRASVMASLLASASM